MSLNDEICKLREKLNKSLEDGTPYEETLRISVELDKLIAQFYNEKEDTKQDENN